MPKNVYLYIPELSAFFVRFAHYLKKVRDNEGKIEDIAKIIPLLIHDGNNQLSSSGFSLDLSTHKVHLKTTPISNSHTHFCYIKFGNFSPTNLFCSQSLLIYFVHSLSKSSFWSRPGFSPKSDCRIPEVD